jgi:hypothetical protein
VPSHHHGADLAECQVDFGAETVPLFRTSPSLAGGQRTAGLRFIPVIQGRITSARKRPFGLVVLIGESQNLIIAETIQFLAIFFYNDGHAGLP